MEVGGAGTLRDLAFSDMYLGHPTLADRVFDVPGAAVDALPIGPSLQEELGRLTQACIMERERAPDAREFKLSYDGVNYRVAVLLAQGGNVFVVRKIANAVVSLAELGIPQAYIRRMMQRELSGLFIVSGALKAGKTMTAGAMLKDRLAAHGGVAVTAENPIELPLEGNHGHGRCFQTVSPDASGALADAFRNILRCRAGTILFGELRDEESAIELLKASFSGYLVITTMLAGDALQTVTRLHVLLNARLGAHDARALLADGLLGVMHQKMVHGARQGPKLETELLFLKDAPNARAMLRKGEFELLPAEIGRQRAAMIAENATAHRLVSG